MVDNSPMGPVPGPQQPDAAARSRAAAAPGPGAAANSPPDLHLLGTESDTPSLRAAAGSPRAVEHHVLLSQTSSPPAAGAVRRGPKSARRKADPVSLRTDADGPQAAAPSPVAAATELSMALAIPQDETFTNPGALVMHPGVLSSSLRLKSAGPASAAQAAAEAVVPGPTSAEEDALAVYIAPVVPSSMELTPADVHEMMSRMVFKTKTHIVCSMVPALCSNTVPCRDYVCH